MTEKYASLMGNKNAEKSPEQRRVNITVSVSGELLKNLKARITKETSNEDPDEEAIRDFVRNMVREQIRTRFVGRD